MYTVREALKLMNINIAGTTAAFQGFGNVSQYAVILYQSSAARRSVSRLGTEDQTSPFPPYERVNVEEQWV